MRTLKVVLVVLALSAVALVGAISADDPAQAKDPALELRGFSNPGTPVTTTPALRTVLSRTGLDAGALRLMGQRNLKRFYTIVGSHKGRCFAIGLEAGIETTLNLITCGDFPAAGKSVLDASVFTYDVATQSIRWTRIQGWTTDDVASVTALAADGRIVATTRPLANFYDIGDSLLEAAAVTKIEARDAAGKVVFSRDVREIPLSM